MSLRKMKGRNVFILNLSWIPGQSEKTWKPRTTLCLWPWNLPFESFEISHNELKRKSEHDSIFGFMFENSPDVHIESPIDLNMRAGDRYWWHPSRTLCSVQVQQYNSTTECSSTHCTKAEICKTWIYPDSMLSHFSSPTKYFHDIKNTIWFNVLPYKDIHR